MYKKNYEAITSFGLLVYSKANNGNILFLLYQRRDTFEYIDFMRGNWSFNNLNKLFSCMSTEERQRIRDYTFKELWDDLWMSDYFHIYKGSYIKAKKKYDSIKSTIPSLLDTTVTTINYPEWGFPKGMKHGFESTIDCAVREFNEETKLSTANIKVNSTINFYERYKGTNNKMYATYYYLANMPEITYPSYICTPNYIRKKTVSDEAYDIKWVTMEEACLLLNPRRKKLLLEAYNKIISFDKE